MAVGSEDLFLGDRPPAKRHIAPPNFRLPPQKFRSGYVPAYKSYLLLYSLYYAEGYREFVGPISASLRQGNTAPFEEMMQR